MNAPIWPLFDLRLVTDRLELRLPSDPELEDLSAVARAGIHAPDEMPFGYPWTDRESPAFERGLLQWHWRARGEWSPDSWRLILAVFLDGRPIGSQDMWAVDFATIRRVDTGSWLGRPFQGQGLGKQMRSAVLALAFHGLGAEIADSAAFLDNPASSSVSRALGYRPNGLTEMAPRGVSRPMERYRLTREDWQGRARPGVEIEGLEACREMFGVMPRP